MSNSKIETPSFTRQISHKNFNITNKFKLGSGEQNNIQHNNKIAGRYKSPSPMLSKQNSKYLEIYKKNNPNSTFQTPKRNDINPSVLMH
jgi:hypothetical protein